MLDRKFWDNKKVFLTGHTGFKGSWMVSLLSLLGAKCKGYALNPPTKPSLYEIIGGDKLCGSVIADIRDLNRLKAEVRNFMPDIVIHMAAQPIVLESYKNPVDTYNINVMGTVNILEAVRCCGGVKAVVNVTTDKVYENYNKMEGYREDDRLGGYDPYSNSKACSELVTSSYRSSFFNIEKLKEHGCGIATARAGNVLGGGDWAEDRLLPDCVRAALKQEKIVIRNGGAVRPWQHVLEPLVCYLKIAENIIKYGAKYCAGFNIGPDVKDCRPVIDVIKLFCDYYGEGMEYTETNPGGFHEAGLLVLDNSKAKKMLGFSPKYGIEQTIQRVVEWTKAYRDGIDMAEFTKSQINSYLQS